MIDLNHGEIVYNNRLGQSGVIAKLGCHPETGEVLKIKTEQGEVWDVKDLGPVPEIEVATPVRTESQPPHLTRYTLFYDEAYERYATVFFDWRYTSSLAQFEWVPKNQLYQLNEPMPYHLHQHLMYVDYAKGVGPTRFQQVMEENKAKESIAA